MPESLMVLVDVAGFTRDERRLIHQLAVREGLYKVLEEAFTRARIDWSSCYSEDRGDGVMILVPPDVPAVVLADDLLDRIVSALRDHNEVHAREASIQLRLVLHAGQVERDKAGVAGPALNFAFRLLAAPGPKTTLRTSGGLLAVIVSEPFYADVISQRPSAVPASYQRIKAEYNGFKGDAWLRVLGERPAEAIAVLGPFPAEETDRLRVLLADVKELDFGELARRAAPSALPLPRFVDAWHAFTRLADVNSGPDGVAPVLVFLDALAAEVGGELGGALAGWVYRQVRAMRVEEAFEERRQAMARTAGGEQRLHLVISLDHDGISPGRYVLSAWRQDDPDVWAPVRSDIREVRQDEIERAVDEIVVATERAWADQQTAVILEAFLPRELLRLPVHTWSKEHDSGRPQPLCLDYVIRIRSLDRLKARHWHRVWRERWKSMHANPSPARIYFVGEGIDPVEVVLRDRDSVAMVLSAPPPDVVGATGDDFTAGLRTGLPVLIWCPGVTEARDLHELVTWLVERGGLFDLPHQSKKSRRAALGSSVYPFDSTHARDLVVLWDDPDRTIQVGQTAS